MWESFKHAPFLRKLRVHSLRRVRLNGGRFVAYNTFTDWFDGDPSMWSLPQVQVFYRALSNIRGGIHPFLLVSWYTGLASPTSFSTIICVPIIFEMERVFLRPLCHSHSLFFRFYPLYHIPIPHSQTSTIVLTLLFVLNPITWPVRGYCGFNTMDK